MRRFVLLVIPALLWTACGDALPCRACPPVDGVYAVSWADGGTASVDGGCSVAVPKVDAWTLAQRTTNVTTQIAGVAMGGTLLDTYDLVLTGSNAGVTYRLRALAIPSGTSADAGMKLQGSLVARLLEESGDLCEASEAFTAQRVSR